MSIDSQAEERSGRFQLGIERYMANLDVRKDFDLLTNQLKHKIYDALVDMVLDELRRPFRNAELHAEHEREKELIMLKQGTMSLPDLEKVVRQTLEANEIEATDDDHNRMKRQSIIDDAQDK